VIAQSQATSDRQSARKMGIASIVFSIIGIVVGIIIIIIWVVMVVVVGTSPYSYVSFSQHNSSLNQSLPQCRRSCGGSDPRFLAVWGPSVHPLFTARQNSTFLLQRSYL